MTKLGDRRLAEVLVGLVDARVKLAQRNGQPLTRLGVVSGSPDTVARKVAVRLNGMSEPSPGFVYSGLWVPRDGDHVRCWIDPRGDRWISDPYGRDVLTSAIVDVIPNPDAVPVDRAAGGIARVHVGGTGSAPVLVQSAMATGLSGTFATLTDDPTPGNTLIASVTIRQGANPMTPPTGFTAISVGTVGAFEEVAAISYRHVEAGDGAVVNTGSQAGPTTLYVEEYEGHLEPDDVAELTSADPSGGPTFVGPAVTPTAGVPAVIVGLFAWKPGSSSATPDAGWTEALDNSHASHTTYVLTKPVAATSGSYTPGGTAPDATFVFDGHSYAAQTASFVGTVSDEAYPLAPQTIDGDDVTYRACELAEALRVDLGAAYRIVRARLVIACSSAGAKSYELRGANEPDYGDEVALTTIAFTSAGGFATNTVSAVWATSTSYRYWRLVGPGESRRINTLELYETTPGQVIVTDPTTDEFAEIDAALAALAAADAVHPADTTAAHAAASIGFTPAGTIAATNVQAAIEEAAAEAGGSHPDLAAHDALGLATDAELSSHTADTTDAHDASAISVLDTGGNFTGTDVEAVLAELDAAIAAGGIPATIFDAKGDLIVASAADAAARLAVGATNGHVLTVDSGETLGMKWAAAAGGGGSAFALDSYLEASGSARNDEFGAGPGMDGKWTLVGTTPDDVDENNDYTDLLLLRRNDTGSQLSAYYQNVPSFPCDIVTKVRATSGSANYARGGGLLLLPATPTTGSAARYVGHVYNAARQVSAISYTNLSSYGGETGATVVTAPLGLWIRVTVLSGGTSIDAYYSVDGVLWAPLTTGLALGFTVANAGIAVSPEGQVADLHVLFDFYRVSA